MAVVVIGGLLTSTFLAIFVTPSLYTLLDDLQSVFFRPGRPVSAVPAERVAVPTPIPAPAMAVAGTRGVGQGNGANGHRGEPAWLQKLKAGVFEDEA
jgi:hypothetical protein